MSKLWIIASVFFLFSLTCFKVDHQSKPIKAVDFLAQPEKLGIFLQGISSMGHKFFYRELPQAYREDKSFGLYHVIFRPKDYAKWNELRDEAVGKKTYKIKKEWATKIVKEIISNEAARAKFDIFAFHVKQEEVTKEYDLHKLITTPKFPCTVYIYKLKGKKWVFLKKEIAKDFVGFSDLRYFVVTS
jgi:hypothetical protein